MENEKEIMEAMEKRQFVGKDKKEGDMWDTLAELFDGCGGCQGCNIEQEGDQC
ncbi:MAG: hypothetical protein PVG39_24200 [Desulfobacteraceae bacterium]|jgi:hypothetical protein